MAWWIGLLRQRGIVDFPSRRSSHEAPVPTAGGLPVIAAALFAWLIAAWPLEFKNAMFLVSVSMVAAISLMDDIRTVNPAVRLLVHVLAVTCCLAGLDPSLRILHPGLPVTIDRLIVGLGWVWFINLYNFMDGIDGLSSGQTALIGAGVVLLSLGVALPAELTVMSFALALAALLFLRWNWAPAQVFLGDVGSVTSGFMIGWLLLHLMLAGATAAALLLPLYFVADATITLVRRALRLERFWEAHREHFYQRPVSARGGHARVASRILAGAALLMLLALVSLALPLTAGLLGIATVGLLLAHLNSLARRREPD